MKEMEGKTVFVSGAGSGIGRASALLLAGAGAKVVAADIGLVAVEETAHLAHMAGGAVRPVALDIARRDDVFSAIRAIEAVEGRLDAALNNAGVLGASALIDEYDPAEFARVMDVNVHGTFHCMQAQIGAMREQGGGSIVNIASVVGLLGWYSCVAYGTSKHAVVGMTRMAALDLAKSRIRVNAVCPGWTDTQMISHVLDDSLTRKAVADSIPMGRPGRPQEMAEAILWLLSDRASFVTGLIMPVDGAYTVQ